MTVWNKRKHGWQRPVYSVRRSSRGFLLLLLGSMWLIRLIRMSKSILTMFAHQKD
jgi:hypothetical protein